MIVPAQTLHWHLPPSTMAADDEGSPLYGEDSASARRQFGSAAVDRRQAAIGPRPAAQTPGSQVLNGLLPAPHLLGKRSRQEYDTPDLPSHADRQQWLESQRAAFEAVGSSCEPAGGAAPAAGGAAPAAGTAVGAATGAPAAGAAGGGPDGEGNSHGSDSSTTRVQRSRSSAQHAAIFSLVYGLLEEGEDRR